MTNYSASSAQRSFCFGSFVLVPEQQLLMDGDRQVRVGSRALEILAALVERPGELVSKNELLARVWPNTFVEEGNLKVNVAALRRALGQGAGNGRYIATVTGRGYRFVAPVRILGPSALSTGGTSLLSRAHNLPNPAARIVGRDGAIAAVLRQFEESRLVTLVGAGGIGKTTVALAVAEHAIGTVEHGVWFVDLAPLRDPALVTGAIATALGLTVHSANISAALSAFLAKRRLMLVLDNCEHVIEAVAACVERILTDATGVRLLATSREPLRARGEQVHRLSPLETPPEARGSRVAEVMAFPAVQLFVERAGASHAGFALNDADAPVVAEICRKLDGMALAIELAAARVDAFSVREILGLLDDRFRLLKGRRTAPERHQSLTAALDWSHDLLSERERTVLRRLSVFAGTFGLDSARAVAADGNVSGLAEDLANLVAKSLVAAETGGIATHYRLLDTTRSYALQKLVESNELGTLRQRHAEHLRDLAERAAADWEIRSTAEWLAYYGPKVDDIRTALNWAFAERRDLAIGVALTVAAIPFWEHLSLVEECRASVERALESVGSALLSQRDEMKLRMALGTTLLHTRGPLPQVKLTWKRALELAEQLGDVEYQLRCLWGLCDYHTWTGDHRSAFAMAQRIRSVAIEKGDVAASINVDRQAGTALRYLGELADARRHLERMIDRYDPPIDRSGIARFQLDPRLAARGTLANVLWLQGHPDQAVRMTQRQLEGARAAGHALALCNALVHAACPIALLVGDLVAAERLLAEIQDHVAKHAMTVWSAMGRCLRGEWLLKRGDSSGLPVLRSALNELSDVGFRMRYAAHLGILAEGLAAHDEVEGAHKTIDEAIALSTRSGEVWCMPELLRVKGDILCMAGSAKANRAAEDLYEQALGQARGQGASSWELRAATSLAELRRRSGASGQASELLLSIYNRFEEGLETRDLEKARTLLNELRESPKATSIATGVKRSWA